jgi:hypothetical protein
MAKQRFISSIFSRINKEEQSVSVAIDLLVLEETLKIERVDQIHQKDLWGAQRS